MISYSALVWLFVVSSLVTTFAFYRVDRRPVVVAIGFGVSGWVLDSQSGFDYLAYSLQIASFLVSVLFVLPGHQVKADTLLSKTLVLLQRVSYVFLFAQLVSALVTSSGYEGTVRALLLVVLLATFNAYSYARQNFDGLPLIIITIAVGTIVVDSLFSITQVSFTEVGGGRYGGIIGHPNYAAYLGAAACAIWYTKRQSFAVAIGLSVTGIATILTLSRTAILALAIALLVISIQKKKILQASLLSIVATFALLLQSGFAATIVERFGWIVSSGGLSGSNSAGWRTLQWTKTVEVIQENNFLPVGWKQSGQYLLSGLEPHNFFLQSQLELGVLGLISSIGFTLAFFYGQAVLRNFGPFAIIGLGSVLDAGLLVPSFLIGAVVMLLSSGSGEKVASEVALPKTASTHPLVVPGAG
jgi:O-antigen ligase